MVVNYSLHEIDRAAEQFLDIVAGKKIIALHGAMAAGKTTFIHSVCTMLKVQDVVSSPTFSIINEYGTLAGEVIFHLDLYRLKDEAEAIAAGVEDCLNSGNLCLVEWPEKAPGIFPTETVHCYLSSISHTERKLQINL